MFFYFTAPDPSGSNSTQHFWRYYDLQTGQILDNRFLIANLITCAPDTPRVIGEADVFEIQTQVQQHILQSVEARAAAEAAPTIVDPIQQTIAAVLREHLNDPALKRSEVRATLRALSLPVRKTTASRLKSACEDYQINEDVTQLLSIVRKHLAGAAGPVEPRPPSTRQPLTADDLHLICWEYVWS